MKLCKKCNTDKDEQCFRILKHGSLDTYCKDCHKRITLEYYRSKHGLNTDLNVEYRSKKGTRKSYDCPTCSVKFKSNKELCEHKSRPLHIKKSNLQSSQILQS